MLWDANFVTDLSSTREEIFVLPIFVLSRRASGNLSSTAACSGRPGDSRRMDSSVANSYRCYQTLAHPHSADQLRTPGPWPPTRCREVDQISLAHFPLFLISTETFASAANFSTRRLTSVDGSTREVRVREQNQQRNAFDYFYEIVDPHRGHVFLSPNGRLVWTTLPHQSQNFVNFANANRTPASPGMATTSKILSETTRHKKTARTPPQTVSHHRNAFRLTLDFVSIFRM